MAVSHRLYFFLFIAEGELDGNCLTGVDSCNDPNAMCVENTCVCNSNYYDSDGIPNNDAGFCTLSKYQTGSSP